MIKINLDKNKKYILCCSYGPDSMCLFDLLLKENIYFEVAHVNYHILTNADEDEDNLRAYCSKNHIKFHLNSTIYTKKLGNEEDRARTYRYDWFKKLSQKIGIENVLIAHNKDDLVETYLMQKDRNSFVSYYGLAEQYTNDSTIFIRPLLNYRKEELLKYCQDNNVPYSIDYSNYDTKYKRNYIRHKIVKYMSDEEFNSLISEIQAKNTERQTFLSKHIDSMKNGYFLVNDFHKLGEHDFIEYFYNFLKVNNYQFEISKKEILDFMNKCCFKDGTYRIKKESYYIENDYGKIHIYNHINNEYNFTLSELKKDDKFIKINAKSPLFSKCVDNFKLIIKPVNPEEFYPTDKYKKKIKRCFIDWKTPLYLRKCWPGIYDKDSNLIYVPRYNSENPKNSDSPLIFDIKDFIKIN